MSTGQCRRERVRCTFDTAHLTYAGEDLLDAAKVYAPRTAHVHLRDAVKDNSLLRYGEGVVDFASVIRIFEGRRVFALLLDGIPDRLRRRGDRETRLFSKLSVTIRNLKGESLKINFQTKQF